MPRVIRALSLAVLEFFQVQSEHGLLGGGGGTVNTRSFAVTLPPCCRALVLPPAGGPLPQRHRLGGRPRCHRPAGVCGYRCAAALQSSCTPSGRQVGEGWGRRRNQAFPRETALRGYSSAQGSTNRDHRDLRDLRDHRDPNALLSDKSCLSSQGGDMRKYTYAQPPPPHDSDAPKKNNPDSPPPDLSSLDLPALTLAITG